MAIEGFDYNAFANDLASQAAEILAQQSNAAPSSLSEEDRKTITDTLRRFCLMAGEALSNDTQVNLNAEQASLITQFIGEWTFHKSIDLINSKIPSENREPILQVIAANIFNTAKLAIIKNLPQDQLITLIEQKVTEIYNEELNKLVQRGILTQEQGANAAKQSNLNDMVQKTQEEAQDRQAIETMEQNNSSDNQTMKFVALAIVLKRLPEEKAQEFLSVFNEEETKHITNYMKMSDIESKVNNLQMLNTLKELKKIIPLPQTLNLQKVLNNFYATVKSAKPEVLSNISMRERENVRDFILDTHFPATEVFAPNVLISIAKTLEDKINDNKEKVF